MAAHGWGTDRPLAELLYEEGFRFELHQAVRLLERMAPGSRPVGEGAEPEKEPVRFRSAVRLDFPPSEVESVSPAPAPGEPAGMTVNVMGLAGSLGPLPVSLTELVIERTFRGDHALAEFLDLFNHRLISLLHRAARELRPALAWARPDSGGFAGAAFAFLGLGLDGVRDRMAVADRSLLPYTGLLAHRPRSAVGLEVLLADYFGTRVQVRQFTGRWIELDDEQRTALGTGGDGHGQGRNRTLTAFAAGAVLGSRVWDPAAAFELHLGPLDLGRFLDFLPVGRGFRALVALVRLYAGDEQTFTVRLTLRSNQVPPCRLACGPRLGWTSWLKTRDFTGDDSQVRLRGVSPAPSKRL